MKEVVSISLGFSRQAFEFTTHFLGEEMRVHRVGANGSSNAAPAFWCQQTAPQARGCCPWRINFVAGKNPVSGKTRFVLHYLVAFGDWPRGGRFASLHWAPAESSPIQPINSACATFSHGVANFPPLCVASAVAQAGSVCSPECAGQ